MLSGSRSIKNMNSKKNLIIGAVIIIILVVGVILGKGGFLGQSVGTALETVGISNKMTDEIYIEAMTQGAKITAENYTAKDSTLSSEEMWNQVQSEMNKVIDKYGISDLEAATYFKALSEDKVRSAAMQEKLLPIMLELLKNGGK